ncbi:hypothetical protein ACE6H2_006841 [Prunus campanulata]
MIYHSEIRYFRGLVENLRGQRVPQHLRKHVKKISFRHRRIDRVGWGGLAIDGVKEREAVLGTNLGYTMAFTSGFGLCAFVLATEHVSPTKRGTAGMLTFYFFSAGIISCVAYIFQQWRELYIASSMKSRKGGRSLALILTETSSLLFLLVVLPFVFESTKWYLVRSKNRRQETNARHCQVHNKHPSEGVVLTLDEETSNDSPTTNEKDQT